MIKAFNVNHPLMGEDYKDADTLKRLHHEDGASLNEIGTRFGVDRSTVEYWANKHGIEIVDYSEKSTEILPCPDGVEIPDDKSWESLSAYQRWYYRNRDKEISRIDETRDEKRAYLREYKQNHGCQECSENHPACLVFHHEEEKSFLLSSAPDKGIGWERIEKELQKCVVLCSNCHRKKHWNEKN